MKTFVKLFPTRAFSSTAAETTLKNTAAETCLKYRVLVVGGGTAGISVAAQLAQEQNIKALKEATNSGYDATIGIIEPSEFHYYQPLWTLVGAGLKKFEESKRSTAHVLQDLVRSESGNRVRHIDSKCLQIDPIHNLATLSGGKVVKYDFLVVASGIECQWDSIPGLKNAIEDPESKVTSNYHPLAVQRTSKMIENLRQGNAIFTQPSTPIKCAGAPQKIMYLAEERWKLNRVRDNINVSFYTGTPKIFAVEKYASALSDICHSRGINVYVQHELVGIDSKNGLATFNDKVNKKDIEVKFDFMHIVPHMKPPAFIKESGLGNQAGFCEIDNKTLQHVKYKNIFAIGDCASLAVSKTASASAAQTHVVSENLLKQLKSDLDSEEFVPGTHQLKDQTEYSGYTACPIVTGKTSLIMAEFNGFTLQPRFET